MRFQKAIDLWSPDGERVLSGQLKLQCGQWVRCGSDRLSRFVKSTGRSIWVAHPQRTPKETLERFKTLVNISK
jgi:hypothetical protein